jgi:hypothetical protein
LVDLTGLGLLNELMWRRRKEWILGWSLLHRVEMRSPHFPSKATHTLWLELMNLSWLGHRWWRHVPSGVLNEVLMILYGLIMMGGCPSTIMFFVTLFIVFLHDAWLFNNDNNSTEF